MRKHCSVSILISVLVIVLPNWAVFAADGSASIEKVKPVELGAKPAIAKPTDGLSPKAKATAKESEPPVATPSASTSPAPASNLRPSALTVQPGSSQPPAVTAGTPAGQTPSGRPINDIQVMPSIPTPAKAKAPASSKGGSMQATQGGVSSPLNQTGKSPSTAEAAPSADPLEERVRGLIKEKLGRDGEVLLRVSPDTPLGKAEGTVGAKGKTSGSRKASNDEVTAEKVVQKEGVDKALAEGSSMMPKKIGEGGIGAAKEARVGPSKSFDSSLAWDWSGPRGPQAWGRLDPSYAACSSGSMQSPPMLPEVSVIESSGPSMPKFNWRPQRFRWARQGPLWTAHLSGGSLTEFRGESYELESIQLRFPGEPFVGEESPVGSLHLVHRLGTRSLILAIPIEIGSTALRNAALATLVRRFPFDTSEQVTWEGLELDATDLLSSKLRSAILFSGSLSYPPCSESVLWLLSRQALSLPEDQVRELSTLTGAGRRPLQALNNRTLLGIGLLP